MTRPLDLQAVFAAAETAIDHSPKGGAAAKAAAARVFDRLRAREGDASEGAPAALPVCGHLDAALRQTHPTRGAVAAALQALAPRLIWARRPSARPTDGAFWDGHANAMLAGPGGLEARDDVWVGVTLMAPAVLYPDHSHAPEETYLALTSGQWWNSDMDWTDPGADGLIYNPPGITHAMRSVPERPFLALWFLPI
jgi:hypothetical protein